MIGSRSGTDNELVDGLRPDSHASRLASAGPTVAGSDGGVLASPRYALAHRTRNRHRPPAYLAGHWAV